MHILGALVLYMNILSSWEMVKNGGPCIFSELVFIFEHLRLHASGVKKRGRRKGTSAGAGSSRFPNHFICISPFHHWQTQRQRKPPVELAKKYF